MWVVYMQYDSEVSLAANSLPVPMSQQWYTMEQACILW